jgi:hypothetical protein
MIETVRQGSEDLTGRDNVTLVTNWFDMLRETLPGSS